jgi:hypothetical protein
MFEQSPRLRGQLVKIFAVLVMLAAVFWLYQYLTKGSVTVTTFGPNDFVSVTQIKSGRRDTGHSIQKQHRLSVRVKPGSYEISAFNRSVSTARTITVKARQHLNFNLAISSPAIAEPVYGEPVSDVYPGSSSLQFLNNDHHLGILSADGSISIVSPDKTLYGIKWASAQIGIVRDSLNNLYVINGGSLVPASLPFAPDKNKSLSYSVSTSGQIYVSQGNVVYKYSAGGWSQAYGSSRSILNLAANDNGVAVIEGSADKNPDGEGEIVLIDGAGHAKHTGIDGQGIDYSRSGRYLSVLNDQGLNIYGNDLVKLGSLPLAGSAVYAWGIKDQFYYSQGGSIWIFNIGSRLSKQLSSAPGQARIGGIYTGDSSDYVYFSADRVGVNADPGSTQLFKAGLSKPGSDSSTGGISAFLPASLDECYMDYVNISRPVITLEPFSNSLAGGCLGSAKSKLAQYGIDPNKFSFYMRPVANFVD